VLRVECALGRIDDLARHFEPRQIRRARRRRVAALSLEHVRPVHAGGRDLDQHFARLQRGHRALARLQHFGRAKFGDFDRFHLLPLESNSSMIP